MDSLRFRPEIEDDLRSGKDWYDSKILGLGDRFIDEFWASIDRIVDGPMSFAASPSGLRRCRLKRFSYLIHFRVQGEEILVVGVMSAARDDSALDNRG
ncbi:MAG: type II toxin-antitoxin system RelE/ParE family toxin [Planctomycetes bacterium]|nr:type II toxin-antitoxin system RelE/ParE family toxin [Planctomycetota bacterium]